MKFLLPCTALGLLLTGCSHKKGAEPPVVIGHVAPFTGPDQAIGEHAKQGIDLAVEEVNKEENRIRGHPMMVLHPDSRSDPAQIRDQAVRLITVDKVAALIMGVEAAPVAEGLASDAQMYTVPLILPTGLPGRSVGDYAFYTGLTPVTQGQSLARFAAQELKGLPVLVLDTGDSGPALADAFVKEFRKAGGTLAAEPAAYKNTAELKDLIGQVRNPAFKAVLLAGPPGDLAELSRAGLDPSVPVLFGGPEGSLKALRAGPSANVVYLATVFVENAGSRAKEFADNYQKHFGDTPDVHAALAYDNARLLFEAMRQAESFEGPKVQKALADMKTYDSLTGPLSFGNDHVASRRVFFLRLKNGQVETVPFEARGDDTRARAGRTSLADPLAALYAAK